LMKASGAGAGAQNVMGTGVFFGMLIATGLGVFIIPGNFTFMESLGRKRREKRAQAALVTLPAESTEHVSPVVLAAEAQADNPPPVVLAAGAQAEQARPRVIVPAEEEAVPAALPKGR
jgi:NADH:ubiquinone oxidoreductase subunit F (NADH-binding)